MPNIDSGSYFLTTLFPIRHFPVGEKTYIEYKTADGQVMSLLPFQSIRHTLSVMRTAHQGPATYWDGVKNGKKTLNTNDCQFAGNLRTHFTRFYVIDNTVFNGRVPSNVLSDTIKNIFQAVLGKIPGIKRFVGKPDNLLNARPVDQLSHPYLAWMTEIDAPEGKEHELDTYLEELWSQMEGKLTEIFEHCHGFDKGKMDAAKFVEFVRKGQVETVMPFHDYWSEPPVLETFLKKGHSYATKIMGCITGGILASFPIRQLICWLSKSESWICDPGLTTPWVWLFVLCLLITIYVGYRDILKYGNLPFPRAPKSSLPMVLKSLYLQQKFVDFASINQTGDANQLHKAFGAFLAQTDPKNENNPTQPAGTICK